MLETDENLNNVVMFPRKNIKDPKNVTLEDVQNNLNMAKHYHIQETIANIAPIIFNQLEVSGFTVSDDEDENIKEGAFLIEALRSIMCKHYNMFHPFQQISENVFIPDLEEEGALRIVDNLNLNLKNESNI
jgi:hypothetical protein